jgi:predicted nuclease of restriction endonuclease-like (RecB) superfamily
MVQFAELFPDIKIVSPLATQLSWSHFIEIFPLETEQARLYYANDAATRNLGIRELRKQISRKAFERQEIANSQLTVDSTMPFNIFKDPYILDTLGLKENFLEADLEKAILKELEAFILEFGHGFTFVERQKRMTMDGDDYTLDLLFYHRVLKRLVAIDLKIGKFVPAVCNHPPKDHPHRYLSKARARPYVERINLRRIGTLCPSTPPTPLRSPPSAPRPPLVQSLPRPSPVPIPARGFPRFWVDFGHFQKN